MTSTQVLCLGASSWQPRPSTTQRPSRSPLIPQSWRLLLVPLFLTIIQTSHAQLDPIRNFCRIFGHQTAVIDNRLYIDGGFINYNPISQYPANYTNTALLYLDLSTITESGMPPLLSTSPPKNSSVPSVHGAALWADQLNKRLYLFGGEPPPSLPTSNYYLPSLWSFDAVSEGWGLVAPKNNPNQVKIDGVSYGAGASVEERGEGYYFGGWITDSSTGNSTGVASGGLVKFDFDEGQWSRNEGPDQDEHAKVGWAEGAMVFIPIGDGGMLVYFGGLMQSQSEDDKKSGNMTTEGQPMEMIYLYDVLSSKWYVQNATGEVPGKRRRFCAGATWAGDKSSYNIYIYGGASTPPDNHPGYDDVYILTIPSFQWLKLYPKPSDNSDPSQHSQQGGAYPHHSLTCNVISQAQMLIIGGSFPLSTDCDVPSQFGTHNLDLGEQNAKKEPWQLFDTNLTTYAVPDVVVKVVGGGKDGGATKREPEKGWAHPDLKVLLTREAKFAARTATRSVTSATGTSDTNRGGTDLSKGAIAGIAVGGAVAISAALVGACWFIRRHRQRRILDQKNRREKSLADGARLGTVASHSDVPSWSPRMTATTGYTSTSPYSDGSFQRQQQGNSAFSVNVPHPPAELEGNTYWQGPDGVTYELTSPGSVVSEQHQQTLQPKVDSQGRVWMQVPPAGRGDHGSPMSRHGTVTRIESESGTPTTTAADPHGTESPISPTHSSTEPQELGVNPKRGSTDATAILTGSAGWDAARGRPKHHTFYHP
ncbi:hypothetical protein GE21DRAFT_4679 [Neurospora crassa]|uniref:Kelch repeat protein n=1 Tax=Neurospora crassa (strain ATCC 24698 / 74-OR23-1A / CBS 708.71 / DSM 1257 / FGSC 987) TaxID=367110 RepID=Q7RZK3_NEUCR|nr:hypothetical protein NCU00363 [Neurospora crassa OR74A]EAA28598.1 hypothetical protein NCU00363 [Neurospora crassa OR74A]KHE89531.1 hypothetical protein GE21DRAFT_4679 [Neurospora crassa]|eukprot:XP_957834.1 hypothetical protein NCU00363 [Neurospora crassa OR74A]